jgi:pyruvate, water dikinase
MVDDAEPAVIWFDELAREDVPKVGGKNASLGEMVRQLGAKGIHVPAGFAITADAYWNFVAANDLQRVVEDALGELDHGGAALADAGARIRRAFLRGTWPTATRDEIVAAYRELCRRADSDDVDVAVRSSATAEDLPDASFAGQHDSYLNICGEQGVLDAARQCIASLFNDRAISYRQARGFDHLQIALSVGVQRMVRADRGGAGVMFTIDTETGFDRLLVISAAWGLGETVVQGTVNPDEYQVFKPLLDHPGKCPIVEKRLGEKARKMIYQRAAKGGPAATGTRNVPTSRAEQSSFVLADDEILQLARWGCEIERHYECPMDVEWAKDGNTGELFIVQARPETIEAAREVGKVRSYRIGGKGRTLTTGLAIGQAVVAGPVCLLESADDIERFVDGSILVTQSTDPDWVPIMKRAAAIVTDQGGRTSHAAIVSRELGLPAVIGTGDATHVLHDEADVTVSCAEGDVGFVYEGIADIEEDELALEDIPETRTKIMLNVANPAAALSWWRLPADGIGLARMEFVINGHIKVHPMALVHYDRLAPPAQRAVDELTRGYEDRTEYFVDRLARGLGRIAAAVYPHPVIVRLSDFKTNEYANLVGGAGFEPREENPMLGFRGASRYYSPRYRDGFALECRALHRLRDQMGFANVIVMVPFCRTPHEAERVLEVMAEEGLVRGRDGLEVYVMCELPSNVVLAREFAQHFDGFSIGSNDLTQLTLGVDRDSGELSELFDEQDDAVKWMIRTAIESAHAAGAKVGLCGQAPSDHPEFAAFLVECGIDSISVTPDSFAAVKRHVAEAERASIEAKPGEPTNRSK